MAEETDGALPSADPADIAAYARLRELQESANHRAFELMAGVAQKLSRKSAGGPSAPAPAAGPAGPPVTARSAEEEAALIPGWSRKELTVAVGYAVDEDGHLHQLVTTNKSKRHKLVDLGPDEKWVKAVRQKRPSSVAGAAPLASPSHATAAQHQSGDVGGDLQPQRKRTAQQSIQDAEARLAAHAATNKLRLIAVGASNNICPHCAAKLGLVGATAASPLAEDPLSEHVPANISGALEAVRKLPAKQPTPPPVIERRWPGRGGGPGSPAGPGGLPGQHDPVQTPTKAETPTASAIAPAAAARSAGPARLSAGPAAESAIAKISPLAVDDDADTQVIQQTQAKRSGIGPLTTPSAGASGGQPTPVAAAPPKVTTEASGDLEKVTRKRVVDESAGTARKITATSTKVGWAGVSAEKERLQTSGGTGTRTVTGGTVARGEGNLTVTGRRDVTKGVLDEEGKLLSGTQTSYTAGGGLIAGPEGFGALGSAAAQQTTAYGKGFSTTKSVGGNARVVVKATQVEGADPPRYQLVVVVTIGASGTVGARGGERAAATASLSASGSVTGTFVHTFTAEQTRRYLSELGRNGVGGAEHELHVIDLVARGSVADARQLLAAYAATQSAGDAAQLPEGDQASLELQGGAGGSLSVTSAGKAPVSVEVSFSKSKSLKRTVARKDGAVLITVEVVADTSGSLGASGSSGYVGGGISYGRKTSAGESVTFRLDPREPSYVALFERIQAIDSAADLTALATSDSGHVVGAGSSSGWATTLTPKANLFGAEVAITTSHAYAESVNIDAAGRRRQFTGSSGGGVDVGIASGPKLGYHSEQTVTTAVGPDRRASGDVSTTTSETDFGASARALASAVDKTPIAGALGLATGGTKLLQSRTEVVGMRLSDEDFATIAAVARDRGSWDRAFRGRVNESFVAWQALGRRIAASGDPEAISRALAQYASGNDEAADAIQAVVRPRGRAEGGKRYDWPATLSAERETYESIVLGDRIEQLRARAAAGAFEEAQTGFTTDNARLNKVAKALLAASESSDAAAVAEMLRRIADAQREIRAELRKLRAALSPAPSAQPAIAQGKRDVPAPSSETQTGPAADQEAIKERNEQIDLLIPELLQLRDKENAIFAEARKDLNDPPWWRGPDVIGIIKALNSLDPVYTQWDVLVEKLRAVFRERGEDGSRADHYGPDRKTRDQIRHHPELTKYG